MASSSGSEPSFHLERSLNIHAVLTKFLYEKKKKVYVRGFCEAQSAILHVLQQQGKRVCDVLAGLCSYEAASSGKQGLSVSSPYFIP